jgi:hypothetical protein
MSLTVSACSQTPRRRTVRPVGRRLSLAAALAPRRESSSGDRVLAQAFWASPTSGRPDARAVILPFSARCRTT